MASSYAVLTGGDSTLVRDFQPLNWSNDRTPRRLVRHLVDDLSGPLKNLIEEGMIRVMEADFLPRGTGADASWPCSIGGSKMKERRRRILIVDNIQTQRTW